MHRWQIVQGYRSGGLVIANDSSSGWVGSLMDPVLMQFCLLGRWSSELDRVPFGSLYQALLFSFAHFFEPCRVLPSPGP